MRKELKISLVACCWYLAFLGAAVGIDYFRVEKQGYESKSSIFWKVDYAYSGKSFGDERDGYLARMVYITSPRPETLLPAIAAPFVLALIIIGLRRSFSWASK